MTAPSNFTASNGVGVITDDQLNTLVQVDPTAAYLRGFIGTTNQAVSLLGITAPGDGLAGTFYWSFGSSYVDDNLNTIVPSGAAGAGAWLRAAVASPATVAIPAGTTTELLGATGTAGVAGLVTLGTNLSITSGTLNATAGGSGVSSIVGGTGLTGGTITTTGTLAVSYGTTAGTAAQGNDTRIVGALQSAAIPAGTTTELLGATGTAGVAGLVTLGTNLSLTGEVLGVVASPTFTNMAVTGTETIGSVTTGGFTSHYDGSGYGATFYAYDPAGPEFTWNLSTPGGPSYEGGMIYGYIFGSSAPPVLLMNALSVFRDITVTGINGMTIGANTGTLDLANSSALVTVGAYTTTLTTTGATSVTLPASGTLLTTAAIPASDTLHLLGPTGTAGAAGAVTIGANLSLTGGTLGVVASPTFTNMAVTGTETIGSVTTGGFTQTYGSGFANFQAYDPAGPTYNWGVSVVGGLSYPGAMQFGFFLGSTSPPSLSLDVDFFASDVYANSVNGMTIGSNTGTLDLANSSALVTVGAYTTTLTTTGTTNVTLPTSGTLLTTAAIPASDTLHLLGATGTAGAAGAVTIGANLSLTAGTLSATGGSGSGVVNSGTANDLAYYVGNSATVSPLALGANLSITSGTLSAATGSGVVNSGTTNHLAYYAGNTATLSSSAALSISPGGVLTVGNAGTLGGAVAMAYAAGGSVSIQGVPGGSTWALTLPTNGGSVGQSLQTGGAGVASWVTSVPAGTAGYLLVATGTAGQSSTSALLPTAAMPALTGDVTNTAGSLATTVGSIGGHAVALGGALTLSGAYPATITMTGSTAVTLPTTGTLVNTAVTTLPSLASINGAAVPTSGTLTNLGTGSTGTGSVVLSMSPVLTAPTLGTATALSVNGLSITTTNGTLNVVNSSTLATSGAYSITLTAAATTNVTLPASGTLVNTAVSTLSSLTTVGTISSGTWNATKITGAYGGTGVNNGAALLTYAGSVTFTGAYASSFALTGTTSLTLPTSGTVTALGNVSTGSGPIALASSPVLVTPTLGVASATSLTTTATITAAATTGAINYGTLSFSDTNNLEVLETNVNSYAQVVAQNTNSGATASSGFVAANNLSTATTYYGNFGINSSGFSGTGSMSLPNATYLTATTGDLVLGTTTSNAIHFVAANGTVDAATISSAGELSVNPAVGTIGGLKGALVRGWDSGAVAVNGSITLINGAPYGLVINSAVAQMGTGSFVSALSIGGATIGGLGAVTVNGTLSTTSATSSNTLAAGGTLTLAVTSATGSPTNGFYQINTTRT